MKILLSSNGPHTPTGYGTQVKGLMYALQQLGHEVAVHSWYGLQGGIIKAGGVILYPALDHHYGGDGAIPAKHFGADLVITLQDIWVLPANFAEMLPCAWAAWFPVDGDPIPPPIAAQAKSAAYKLAYSQFGLSECINAGIDDARYIPLAVDTDTFKPLESDRDDLRRKHGFNPDDFVISMVAANKGYPNRKGFPEAMLAFKQLHKKQPNTKLYLHTKRNPPKHGIDLGDVLRLVDLPHDAVIFPPQGDFALGYSDEQVAEIYQLSDLLLAPSMGEGFGLPIVEAQACGTPVITTNCSSMPEITKFGYCLDPVQPTYNALGQWHYVPDIDEITSKLFEVYRIDRYSSGYVNNRNECVQHVQSTYSWNAVLSQHWHPFLSQVEQDLGLSSNHNELAEELVSV